MDIPIDWQGVAAATLAAWSLWTAFVLWPGLAAARGAGAPPNC